MKKVPDSAGQKSPDPHPCINLTSLTKTVIQVANAWTFLSYHSRPVLTLIWSKFSVETALPKNSNI